MGKRSECFTNMSYLIGKRQSLVIMFCIGSSVAFDVLLKCVFSFYNFLQIRLRCPRYSLSQGINNIIDFIFTRIIAVIKQAK